jgi:hypothetical protein
MIDCISFSSLKSFAFVIAIVLLMAGCSGSSSTPVSLSSIAITPNPVYIGTGTTTFSLMATGTYSNGTSADITSQVKWTSTDPTTARVGSTGVVTRVSSIVGAITEIKASSNGVTSPSAIVTVTVSSSVVSNNLITARYDHTATELLAGSGVVVAGGFGNSSKALKSAELYDLNAGTFTNLPDMNIARRDHTATRLANGQVLLIGGGGDPGTNDLNSAELYDPLLKTWSLPNTLSTLNTARSYHTATLLSNGKVLVVGGGIDNRNELYDPMAAAGSTASLAADDVSASGRYSHTATLLTDGRVLVTGGFDGTKVIASVELFDPTGATISKTSSLATPRFLHSATLLNDGTGRVLVVGGMDDKGLDVASAELYEPVTNQWSSAGSMTTARFGQTATLFTSGINAGKVLVMGGSNASNAALTNAELYDPANNTWTGTANLQVGRDVCTATLLTAGANANSILVTGGIGAAGVLNSVELHN